MNVIKRQNELIKSITNENEELRQKLKIAEKEKLKLAIQMEQLKLQSPRYMPSKEDKC